LNAALQINHNIMISTQVPALVDVPEFGGTRQVCPDHQIWLKAAFFEWPPEHQI